jgi:hypothetical protein
MAEYNAYERECLNNLTTCLNEHKKYKNNFVVDIGCSYNSWFLEYPFLGILIDSDIKKILSIPNNNLYTKLSKKVTPYNICDILKQYNTPKEFYCLNLDTDGCDLFILIALLKQYTPKIIITEINEKIPYPVKFSMIYHSDYEWEWNHMFGYSIACLEDIMTMFNYSIKSLTMNNVILVKNEENQKPNIDEIRQIYLDGYLNNKIIPPPGWNDDVKHLHDCKTKEEVADKWRQYFIENVNPNNNKQQTRNLDKYVINDTYEEYLQEFLKCI